jgi:penicillin-binding protein 2
MYSLLAAESQAAFTPADFEKQYRTVLQSLTGITVTAQIKGIEAGGDSARAQVHLSFATAILGNLETEVSLEMKKQGLEWRVVFAPNSIWPDLVNGQTLYIAPIAPDRGSIFDRNGAPMVKPAEAYAVGVVPASMVDPNTTANALGRLFGVPGEAMAARYEFAPPDEYFPIGEISVEEVQARKVDWALGVSGIQVSPYQARYYYGGGAAAHVTGYTVFIPPDQLAAYQLQGYFSDQRIGAAGLELWGETQLAGRNGGQLILLDANNQVVSRLTANVQPVDSQDIYSTVDFELQKAVQFALGGYTGAAVVIDVHTGAILALASGPPLDPNLFDSANINTRFTDNSALSAGLLNHATQGTYPAGSVFKVVTFSAGLASGLFTPDSIYTCTGTWNELNLPQPLSDWKEGGHGTITLAEGLAGSCNPYFYHVGYALYNFDPTFLSQTARGFGLGDKTGLPQLDELPGVIPDPAWTLKNEGRPWEPLDSINLSIGQGNVLVTPLQIARMMAAIGNGGTLYQPQLVLKVQPTDGSTPTYEFQPVVIGQLPLKPEQLTALQNAMFEVTRDCAGCLGTARNRFRGLPSWLKVAGKTGTAEDPGEFGLNEPDAWFAGFTYDTRTNAPDIAIAVVVQNQGQGSAFAAPIFRRIVEARYGLNYARYPWESAVGVVAQPTPTPTAGVPAEATPTP